MPEIPPWVLLLRTTGESVRLICFPYTGGGPYIFQKWSTWLPEHVALHAVNLPGRGAHLRHTPVKQLQQVVNGVVKNPHSLRDLPFAIFGHSIGALQAFETARALGSFELVGPRLLIASGCTAPQTVAGREGLHDLPDEAFLEKIKKLGGTPTEFLQNDELMALLTPSLRADFLQMDSCQYQAGTPLDCPITVVSGAQDEFALRIRHAGRGNRHGASDRGAGFRHAGPAAQADGAYGQLHGVAGFSSWRAHVGKRQASSEGVASCFLQCAPGSSRSRVPLSSARWR